MQIPKTNFPAAGVINTGINQLTSTQSIGRKQQHDFHAKNPVDKSLFQDAISSLGKAIIGFVEVAIFLNDPKAFIGINPTK